MKRKPIIKTIVCSYLLVLFALSITPKRFVHNVFANHTDKQSQKSTGSSDQLSSSTYNCDDDNQVAEPGLISSECFETPSLFTFSNYIVKNISFTSSTANYSSLRGPPVNI